MLRPKFVFLPEGRASGGLLPWVIAVMMYLSGLALASGLALESTMSTWSGELDRRVTVQVVAADAAVRAEQVAAAVEALKKLRGVADVRAVSDEETKALLEPWLGVGNVVEELPVPALIDVTLDPLAPATPETMRHALAAAAPQAQLDDHQRWLGQVRRLLDVIVMTLAVVLTLVLLATVAIVTFGTRARLAMYDQTVEIMHLIGADDRIIAREFQWRFLTQGLRGGLIGALAALLTLAIIAFVASRTGGGLLPSLHFDLRMATALALIPPAAGLITMITARITVLRALGRLV